MSDLPSNQKINSAYSISIRSKEAKYNRDMIESQRKQRNLEKTFKHNERKLKVTQRGIMSLLGREPFPDCHPDKVLFSHNLPGFCYRRDGAPRQFDSLSESKTRKILDDLEGSLGYLEDPASNILSDSPQLSDALSTPAILQILCNLRSTAAIMRDPHLFRQFVRNVHKSAPRPLRFKENTPSELLRQYRTDLINQLLNALHFQAKLKMNSSSPQTASTAPEMTYFAPPSQGDNGKTGGDEKHTDSDFRMFTEALKARLEGAQEEPFDPRYSQTPDDAGGALPVNDRSDLANDPVIKQQLLNLGLRKIESFKGLSPSVYGFHDTTGARPETQKSSESDAQSRIPDVGWQNIEFEHLQKGGLSKEERVQLKRQEFETFVKNLIAEVHFVNEAAKGLMELRGKNTKDWQESVDSPAGPALLKLLRKKSLFSSLNEDDLTYYEQVNAKQDTDAEKKAGGEAISTSEFNNKPFSAKSALKLSSGASIKFIPQNRPLLPPSKSWQNSQYSMDADESHVPMSASSFARWAGNRSIGRVGCGACKAKMRGACDVLRAREMSEKNVTRGGQGWCIHTKDKKPKGIKGVPTPQRKSYVFHEPKNAPVFTTKPPSSNTRAIPGSPLDSRELTQVTPSFLIKNKYLLSSPRLAGTTNDFCTSASRTATLNSGSGSAGRKLSRAGTPWTLKVSRLDILKLRHELEVEQIQEDLEEFAKKVDSSRMGIGAGN